MTFLRASGVEQAAIKSADVTKCRKKRPVKAPIASLFLLTVQSRLARSASQFQDFGVLAFGDFDVMFGIHHCPFPADTVSND